ncbi:hypothetical protein [Photorhabdus sp. MH8.4]
MDGVQPDKGINGFQRALLPLFQLGNDLVCHSADGGTRDAEGLQVFNFPADIGVAHPEGKQADNLPLYLV